MARTITLKNPERFKDPANLTWERYVALQARERERYLAERASIPADALAYRTVSPRYLERAVDQFANNYYSELSATHYIATAAANAPFDELKKCCLFQVADEQRHLEMDREVFERAGIPERDWLPAWEAPGTTCRFFRHLLELEDTIEILVKGNFVAEGAAGPGTFAVLADDAEASGDQRCRRDPALGDVAERRRELVLRVAQHELQIQLLDDPEHRMDRVGLHAHADHDDARAARRRRHDLVQDAGHADALEDDGGTQRGTREPRRRLRRPRRLAPDRGGLLPPRPRRGLPGLADDVGAEGDGQLAAARREIGGDDRPHVQQAQRGDHRETDRTAADDERRVVALQTRLLHRVQADGHRLGEGRLIRRPPPRDREEQPLPAPPLLP